MKKQYMIIVLILLMYPNPENGRESSKADGIYHVYYVERYPFHYMEIFIPTINIVSEENQQVLLRIKTNLRKERHKTLKIPMDIPHCKNTPIFLSLPDA